MYGLCSENSTLKPWNGERCMPAMKPSTTSRARTSRCESRATTAGSSSPRPPAPPASPERATPRSGWAPEAERGAEGLTSDLPGRDDEQFAFGAHRLAAETARDLPAREARGAEQQPH